ncbi:MULTISPECIES: SAV_915 family protein [unclassified Streptomyces]|uniref:SAV_915 family protein n=1 Tax=unclassified Streptomyces TaxID=2593676 RepID=UPI0035DC0589
MDSTQPPQETPDVLVLPTMTDLQRDEDGAPILDGTVDVMLIPLQAESGGEQLVALAFSTVARLVEALGEEQPWVALPTDKLEAVLQGSGAGAILMDPRLPGSAGNPTHG